MQSALDVVAGLDPVHEPLHGGVIGRARIGQRREAALDLPQTAHRGRVRDDHEQDLAALFRPAHGLDAHAQGPPGGRRFGQGHDLHRRPDDIGIGDEIEPGPERWKESFAAWRRFFEALASVSPETASAVEELHAEIRRARRSKRPVKL